MADSVYKTYHGMYCSECEDTYCKEHIGNSEYAHSKDTILACAEMRLILKQLCGD